MSKKVPASYVSIKDASGRCNVFGIVRFSKPPTKTKGTDHSMTVSITDPSLPSGDKLVCILFHPSLDALPHLNVGDVIRFHRLKIQSFNDKPQGEAKSSLGCSWLVFGADTEQLQSSSTNFICTDEDRQKAKKLQAWAAMQCLLTDSSIKTLATLEPGKYCDLSCQVLGTCVEEEGSCFVTRVWDGTKVIHPCVSTQKDMNTTCDVLEQLHSSLVVDVWIYDDHFQTCLDIKPGQFLKMCNLHAAISKDPETGQPFTNATVVELVIHRGTSYGRGIVFLSSESPEVHCLKQRMQTAVSDPPRSDTRVIQVCERIQNCEDGASMQVATHPENIQAVDTAVKQKRPSRLATVGDGDNPVPGCSFWEDSVPAGLPEDFSEEQASGVRLKSDEGIVKCDISESSCNLLRAVESRKMEKTVNAQNRKRKYLANNLEHDNADDMQKDTSPVTTQTSNDKNLPNSQDVIVISSGSMGSGEHAAESQRSSGEVEVLESPLPDNELMDVAGAKAVECESTDSSYTTSLQSISLLPKSSDVCMLQTATVITGHHHVSRTSLREILDHSVPYKFRVLANLVDFSPSTTDVSDFVYQLCPRCMSLKKIGKQESVQKERTKDNKIISSVKGLAECLGGDFGNWDFEVENFSQNDEEASLCSKCSTNSEPVVLELTFVLRMVLTDSTKCFVAVNLWREHATKFFGGIKPEEALADSREFQKAISTLHSRSLVHSSKAQADVHLFDCCIFSYSTPFGTNYQLFDTVLA